MPNSTQLNNFNLFIVNDIALRYVRNVNWYENVYAEKENHRSTFTILIRAFSEALRWDWTFLSTIEWIEW